MTQRIKEVDVFRQLKALAFLIVIFSTNVHSNTLVAPMAIKECSFNIKYFLLKVGGYKQFKKTQKSFVNHINSDINIASRLIDEEIYELDAESFEFDVAFASMFSQVSDQIGRIPNYYEFKTYLHDEKNPFSFSGTKWAVTSIQEDERGDLWITTDYRGLNKLDRRTDQFIRFHHNPQDETSLSFDEIFQSYLDKSGFFWTIYQ